MRRFLAPLALSLIRYNVALKPLSLIKKNQTAWKEFRTCSEFSNFAADDEYAKSTMLWLDRVVVAMKLCPWAKSALTSSHFSVGSSDAKTKEELLYDIQMEILRLVEIETDSEVATSLVVARPPLLEDFDDFLDMVEVIDEMIDEMKLRGVIQLATFHPKYKFEGESEVQNYTNRSPYPTFHFLLEKDISKALETYDDTESIWTRNQATMRQHGEQKMDEIISNCRENR